MAGQIIISNIKTDSDNAFSILANTGAVIFSANLASGITTGIADSSITNAKLAGSITGDKITVGSLAGNVFTANTITGDKITVGSLAGNVFTANTITGDKIGQSAISSNNIVSVDGSTVTSASITPAKLSQPFTSGTAVASTSGTSIDFTGIPSWVKRITVSFSGVSTNGSSAFLLQLGDSGGVETTGYSSTNAYNGNVLISTSTIGFLVSNGAVAARTYFGNYVVSLLDFSTNNWVGNGQLMEDGFLSFYSGAGGKALSATLDRVRITTVNGTDTFDAGSINILYE